MKEIEDFEIPLDGLEFSDAEIAVYLSFDEAGKFVQAGVNVNISASMEVSEQGSGMKVEVGVKGGVELKLFTGTVTLPEDLSDYKLQEM